MAIWLPTFFWPSGLSAGSGRPIVCEESGGLEVRSQEEESGGLEVWAMPRFGVLAACHPQCGFGASLFRDRKSCSAGGQIVRAVYMLLVVAFRVGRGIQVDNVVGSGIQDEIDGSGVQDNNVVGSGIGQWSMVKISRNIMQ